MSLSETFAIPEVYILLTSTILLYANEAKIHILCAASIPSISKLGLASAYPKSIAFFNSKVSSISKHIRL